MESVTKIKPLTKAEKTKKEIEKISKSINKNMTDKYLKRLLSDSNN